MPDVDFSPNKYAYLHSTQRNRTEKNWGRNQDGGVLFSPKNDTRN